MDRAAEQASLTESHRRLDDYLTIGTNVLSGLREQGAALKVRSAGIRAACGPGGGSRASAPRARVCVHAWTCGQSTQRRLLDLANTLGVAPQLIRLIERGNRQDWFILFGGMAVTVLVMWLTIAYLRR